MRNAPMLLFRFVPFALLAGLLFYTLPGAAQVTIARGLPGCLDGGISRVGMGCGGGSTVFGLSGGQFVVGNVDGAACCATGGDFNSFFQFPQMNISGFTNVSVSLNYSAANNEPYEDSGGGPYFGCTNSPIDNAHDQIVFAYSVNGGPFIQSLYVHGTSASDFTGTWNLSGINGNTLIIRVWASNKATAEIFYFSNLIVTGTPATIDAGPDRSTCGTVAVTLAGSGTGTWSGGSGTFTNPNSPTASYTPSAAEAGTNVTLTYRGAPATAACASAFPPPSDQMVVTVNTPPTINPISNVSVCGSYTLPAITGTNLPGNEAYFTGTNGTGTRFTPGTVITSTRTLFAYAGVPGCSNQRSFTITITAPPNINAINNVTACGSYTLPPISGTGLSGANPAYFTGPDRTGTRFNPGQAITTSMQLYAHAGVPGCSDEESFFVTIEPAPNIMPIANVTACASYTLPPITAGTNLSGNQAYFTGANGTGTRYEAGAVITSSVALYAYDGVAGCSDQERFNITINPQPDLDSLPNVSACGSFTLPPITGILNPNPTNTAYFSGPNRTGSRFNPGTAITSSTTLFAYSGVTGCSDQQAFTISINTQPFIDSIPDQNACAPVILPPITGSNLSANAAYFTGPGGTGTRYSSGQIISTSTNLYAYDVLNTCAAERAFDIRIFTRPSIVPVTDTTVCDFFILPPIRGAALTGSEAYFTAPEGAGMRKVAGDTIFRSERLFVYDISGVCSAQDTFDLNVLPAPRLNPVTDTTVCISLELPPISGTGLSGNQGYFTRAGGMGVRLNPGTVITDTTRLFIYDAIGVCQTERTFLVQPVQPVVLDTIPDVVICGSYTLPVITGANLAGNEAYFTGPGGTGARYLPGQTLTGSDTLYIFGGLLAGCADEQSFFTDITDGPQPVLSIAAPIPCFGDSTGALLLSVSGGVLPYTITWSDSTLSGTNPTMLKAGTYSVTVGDSGGCNATARIVLPQPDELRITCAEARPTGRINGNDGQASVTITGGTAPYRIVLDGPVTAANTALRPGTAILDGLRPGTYTATVRDSMGCSQSCVLTITEPICTMQVTLNAINPLCAQTATGSVAAIPSNGTGPFTYDWNIDSLDGRQNLVNLPAGLFAVTITDSIGCQASQQIALSDPAPLVLSCAPGVPVSTVRGSDGRAPFSLSGGTFPYAVSWTGASSGAQQLSQAGDSAIVNLRSGSYRLQVSDQNGCLDTCSFLIEEPICTLRTEIILLQGITCNRADDGSLFAKNTDGKAPYSHRWSGPAAFPDQDTLSLLPPGAYSVTVTDAIGCSDSSFFLLTEPPALNVQCVVLSDERTRGGNGGRAVLRFRGGTGPIQVSWPGVTPGNIETSGPDSIVLSGLFAGTYDPLFTDAMGCMASCAFTIEEIPCTIRSSAATVHPSCAENSDGSIVLSVSGGNVPFSFAWSTGAVGQGLNALSNLGGGTYRITITDALNCKDTVEAVLSAPLPLTLVCDVVRNVSEFGLNDGSASFTVNGGTGPYTIFISGERNDTLFLNAPGAAPLTRLYAGTYSAEVSDANGCRMSCNLTISQPPCRIAVSFTPTPPDCFGAANGGLSPVIINGRRPFLYDWSVDSLDGRSVAGGLLAGTYSLTVTDSVGCQAGGTATINNPPLLELTCLAPSPTNRLNASDGHMRVRIQGGSAPYRLTLSGVKNAIYIVASAGEFTVDSLARGDYTLTLTDINNCQAASICNFRIDDPPCDIQVNLIPRDPACFGQSNGGISSLISGGNAPFNFDWSNDTLDGSSNPNNLRAGTYTVTITDDRLCRDTVSVELRDPPLLQTVCEVVQHPQTLNGSEGIALIQVSGGTAPRRFQWLGPATGMIANPAGDTVRISGLTAGAYTALVTDANNCVSECNLTLNPIICRLNVRPTPADPHCHRDSSGRIQLEVSGNIGALSYFWNTGATTQNLTNLSSGAYSVTISDAALCRDTLNFILNDPPALFINPVLLSGPTGVNRPDSRVRLSYGGGRPPLTISWNGPVSGQRNAAMAGADTLSNFPDGNYTFSITDSAGCTASSNLVIDPFSCRLAVSLSAQPLGCETASIRSAVVGANGALTYDWNRNELDGQANPAEVRAGSYALILTDEAGCSAEASIEVRTSGPMNALIEGIGGDCPGDPGIILVDRITGGKSPYSIAFNNASSRILGTPPVTQRNIAPGSISIRLQSSDGCLYDTLIVIEPVRPLRLDIGPNVTILKGDSVLLDPFAGFIPETVRWTPPAGLSSASELKVVAKPLITTTYQLQVTDMNGCPVSDVVTIVVRDDVPIFFPTAFSPNGDQVNDFFTGFAGPLVESIDLLSIFDRWGELVFQTTNILPNEPESGWNGNGKNGTLAPGGVYIFRAAVRLRNGDVKFFAGEVLLVR